MEYYFYDFLFNQSYFPPSTKYTKSRIFIELRECGMQSRQLAIKNIYWPEVKSYLQTLCESFKQVQKLKGEGRKTGQMPRRKCARRGLFFFSFKGIHSYLSTNQVLNAYVEGLFLRDKGRWSGEFPRNQDAKNPERFLGDFVSEFKSSCYHNRGA